MHNKKRIYLDHAATSPLLDESMEEMVLSLKNDYGNPSSIHAPGKAAGRRLDDYRGRIKVCIEQLMNNEVIESARSQERNKEGSWEVTFTSGGTEANVTAFWGILSARRPGRIVTTSIEHSSVLECGSLVKRIGGEVVLVAAENSGLVDPERLLREVDGSTVMVSMMSVNNETGIIQPVMEVSRILKAKFPRVVLHTDAVQALGNVPLAGILKCADLVSLSAHKIGGPRGCGALLRKRGVSIQPLICGGGQEDGMRSGTENVPAIGGFVKAVETISSTFKARNSHMTELRELLHELVCRGARGLGVQIKVNEVPDRQSPHILSVSVPGVPSEALTRALSQRGVDVSHGSACHSRKQHHSHVLRSMGLPPNWGTVRFSLSHSVSREDVQSAAAAWVGCVEELKL